MITRLIFDLDQNGNEIAMRDLVALANHLRTGAAPRNIKVRMVTTGSVFEVTDEEVTLEDDRGKHRVFK